MYGSEVGEVLDFDYRSVRKSDGMEFGYLLF